MGGRGSGAGSLLELLVPVEHMEVHHHMREVQAHPRITRVAGVELLPVGNCPRGVVVRVFLEGHELVRVRSAHDVHAGVVALEVRRMALHELQRIESATLRQISQTHPLRRLTTVRTRKGQLDLRKIEDGHLAREAMLRDTTRGSRPLTLERIFPTFDHDEGLIRPVQDSLDREARRLMELVLTVRRWVVAVRQDLLMRFLTDEVEARTPGCRHDGRLHVLHLSDDDDAPRPRRDHLLDSLMPLTRRAHFRDDIDAHDALRVTRCMSVGLSRPNSTLRSCCLAARNH